MKSYKAAFIIVLVTLSGCSPRLITRHNIDEHGDKVLVSADSSVSLTVGQLYEKLKLSNLLRSGGNLDPALSRQFLDSVMVDTLAGVSAARVDLRGDYEYYREYWGRYSGLLIDEFWQQAIYEVVTVDSAEAVEFYDSRPDLYSISEQVKINHIMISSQTLRWSNDSAYYNAMTREERIEEARKMAYNLRFMIDMGESLESLAKEYSHDVYSKDSSGDAGWLPRGAVRYPFDSIAFSMADGEVSQPYYDGNGWHIIKVSGHISEGIPELTPAGYVSAYSTLVQMRANEQGLALLDSLRRETRFVYNDSVMKSNVYELDRELWAAVINGIDTVTVDDLRDSEEGQRKAYKVDNSTPEMKKEVIDRYANRFELIAAARRMGIDRQEKMVQRERSIRLELAKKIVKREQFDHDWRASEEAVREWFDTHIDDYIVKKPLTVQHIIVKDSIFGEFLRDQAMAGVDFLDLAAKYYPGEEDLRRELADLGPIGPGDIAEGFFNAGKAIPVGEVSHPIRTEFGYHIIKNLGYTPGTRYQDARLVIFPMLKKEHDRQMYEAFRKRLYSEYNVRFHGAIPIIHLRPLKYRWENK